MNILNGNEAFAAMMAGRNILCRAVGEMPDFDNIDQFPATIFAKPGYEFCIKIETIEVAGITFSKPLTLEDVKEGQEIFMVYPDHISHIKYTKLCGEYFRGVVNGFAQADQENAELQLQAIGELFGRVIAYPLTVDNTGKTKKKRTTKIKNDVDQTSTPAGPGTTTPNIEKQPESEMIQAVETTTEATSVSVEKKTSESQSNIQITKQGPITAVEESLVEEFIETDAVKLVEKFTAQINEAETIDAVMQIRYQLNANGHMVRGQIIELNKLGEKRIEALNESQVFECDVATGPVETKELSVDELKRLQEEAEKLIQPAADSTEKSVQVGEDVVHQELLADLLERVAKAASPAEANAQIKYTKSWTQEQRTPLISAINKRLIELNPPKTQPSLAVRIQRAEDLTELDALEIDVSACDEEIQPRLMELVEKRRLELDPFTAAIGEP
ncbi:hypothetical protein B9T23_01955 [Acinetobacter terrae]|uniref:hypothetical protein n=1 Tax=Acinetobacter terrae TaxID=2731247 RepID=UPI000A335882|nr:hypothetical protein [Acinetobacter terrae]OTG78857.1 hypothetical protein B9T23_01955 [Acinetobacter terrae]